MANPIIIKSNLTEAGRIFKSLGAPIKKKLKFVLHDTSMRARDAARRRIAKAFKIKGASAYNWLRYGVKSTKSVKSDLEAAIWLHSPDSKQSRGFLHDQEFGGSYGARRHKRISVPTKAPGRTGRGRIRGAQQPKALFKKIKAGGFKRVSYFTRNGQMFKVTTKKVRGTRKKRIQSRKVQLMYTFAKTVKKKPIFGYYAAIQRNITRTFEAALNREINETMVHYFNKLGSPK